MWGHIQQTMFWLTCVGRCLKKTVDGGRVICVHHLPFKAGLKLYLKGHLFLSEVYIRLLVILWPFLGMHKRLSMNFLVNVSSRVSCQVFPQPSPLHGLGLTHAFTPTANLACPLHLTWMLWTCVGETRASGENPRRHANSKQQGFQARSAHIRWQEIKEGCTCRTKIITETAAHRFFSYIWFVT